MALNDSLLEPLVIEAVTGFGGAPDGLFNSAQFAAAVKRRFGLDVCPDGGWCSRVLLGLPYVVPMPGGCHWLYSKARPHPFAKSA
jgi:hypothetical protein